MHSAPFTFQSAPEAPLLWTPLVTHHHFLTSTPSQIPVSFVVAVIEIVELHIFPMYLFPPP